MPTTSPTPSWRRPLLSLFLGCLLLYPHTTHAKPSKAFRKLAPYRKHVRGFFPYIAKHFWRIYGRKPLTLARLQPLYPRLGFPAFHQPGQTLRIEYIGEASSRKLLKHARYWLIPRHKKHCTPPSCRPLGRIVKRVEKPLANHLAHFSLWLQIPKQTPPGFYDLLHQIPRKAKASSPRRAPTTPTPTTRPHRPHPVARPLPARNRKNATRPSTRPAHNESNPTANKKTHQQRRVPAAVRLFAKDPLTRKRFLFVHLTDLHERQHVGRRIEIVVAQLNKLKPRPDFVALTGDIVEYGNVPGQWKRALRKLKALQLPLIAQIGNHDYYRVHFNQPPAQPGLLREEEGLFHFLRTFHPFLNGRFSFGGYRWLIVDTGPSATSQTWYRLRWITTEGLTKGQRTDIKRFLKTPAPVGHVLLAHGALRSALFHTASGCNPGRHGVLLRGRQALEKLMIHSHKRRPRPLVYLHGHLHWNDLYIHQPKRPKCPFRRYKPGRKYTMMGKRPCWRRLPMKHAPLQLTTQSATKHQPLRSGGWLQWGMRFGQGAGVGYGFRLIRVQGKRWDSALYRFYHRTTFLARQHPDGTIAKLAHRNDLLPACK